MLCHVRLMSRVKDIILNAYLYKIKPDPIPIPIPITYIYAEIYIAQTKLLRLH